MSTTNYLISKVRSQMDEMLANPQEATVKDYCELAKKYSSLLIKQEFEQNMRNQNRGKAEIRDAVSREYKV